MENDITKKMSALVGVLLMNGVFKIILLSLVANEVIKQITKLLYAIHRN